MIFWIRSLFLGPQFCKFFLKSNIEFLHWFGWIILIMMMVVLDRGRMKHNIAVSQQSSIALPTICFKACLATMMIMTMILKRMTLITTIQLFQKWSQWWWLPQLNDADNNHPSHFTPSVSKAWPGLWQCWWQWKNMDTHMHHGCVHYGSVQNG